MDVLVAANMPTCPRCHQTVDSQAIACPYCRTALKAHGHPGIPLYRASGETYLCDSCTYHEDDTCNFPQRPYAEECTLYHDRNQPTTFNQRPVANWQSRLLYILRYRQEWWILSGLLIVSLAIALANQ